VVLLIGQARQGELKGLPMMLAALGAKVTVVSTSGLVGVSTWTGNAVAPDVAYSRSGEPRLTPASFCAAGRPITRPSPLDRPSDVGSTFPAGADLSADPGPFTQRMVP
jgi:hypothetical protein